MADATREFALVIVDELSRQGVAHAVVAPGSRSTPIALALLEHPLIETHVRIDERSASFLALGIAKASGRPVPVLCTSGTAAAEFHAAVLEADQAGVPLLLLTADRPPELRGIGANQTVDQANLYGGAVRWAVDVGGPEPGKGPERYAGSVVSRAVTTALGRLGGGRGPVQLNLPLREPLVPADGPGRPPATATTMDQAAPGNGDAPVPGELEQLLAGVTRGVVVAGDMDADWSGPVARFAATVGWPLIAEPHSGARHGTAALRCSDPLLANQDFVAAHRPDVVLVAGRVGLSRTLLGWLGSVRHVVLTRPEQWVDPTRTALAVLPGDASLFDRLQVEPAPGDWLAGWQAASGAAAAAMDGVLDAAGQLNEPLVARDLPAMLAPEVPLVVASSMPIRDLDALMRPQPRPVFSNRGVSGIDGFVSTAQGVAIGAGRPACALAGDLSLLHDGNGLLPGPDIRPDVTYVVLNNDGGGIFSLLPQGRRLEREPFERLFGTPHGVDLARFAAAYQCSHALVSTAEELADAVAPGPGVKIVEVRTDRAENAALHERLREAAAAAVALTLRGQQDH